MTALQVMISFYPDQEISVFIQQLEYQETNSQWNVNTVSRSLTIPLITLYFQVPLKKYFRLVLKFLFTDFN